MNSIAIIDSGIDINFKEFKNKNIKGLNINTYETTIDSINDYSGHGTSCAAEIFRINPDADINVIKALNENSQSSVKKLIESIEYASEIDDIKLISLSCSTFQDKYLDDFKKVIEHANKKNKILICSSDNTNKVSYPSYMNGVIGVQRCCASIDKYWFNKNLDIQCICEATYRLLPNMNRNYKLFGGNSYSAAYFCGILSKLIKDNIEIENKQITEIIIKNADKTKWHVDDINKYTPLETEFMNKKYDYHKLKMLIDLITNFSKQNIKYIGILPIYTLIGIDNTYEFFRYVKSETKKSIAYNEVTHKDLLSVYSLYNLIFKDDKNEKQ